eukprot:2908220-Amphidinium_carterae.1
MVAAGYCMYGAATELVLTYGGGVQRFALDPALGEFLYVSDMKMDPKGGKKIFSCNEGNSLQWDEPIIRFVEDCKDSGYAARYVGSMVSDVHRTLLYGGIFLYPADKKSTNGKLRVLYEGFPMAMITEQAGGVASTGLFKGTTQRVMDVMPAHIHDRCPIIMGADRDCSTLLKLYSAPRNRSCPWISHLLLPTKHTLEVGCISFLKQSLFVDMISFTCHAHDYVCFIASVAGYLRFSVEAASIDSAVGLSWPV